MHSIRIALLAGVLLLWAGPVAGQTFAFTAIPDQDVTRLQDRFGKVADYLEEELGVAVRYVPVKSYASAVNAFRNDQVQLAWFGGLSGVRARLLVPGSRAIAQGASDRRFRTYFIANTATKIEPTESFPSGLAGLTFAFGSKGSTSGRLMPEHYIRKHLGPPEEVFQRVGFSGNHSQTIDLVATGAYQAGAVNFKVWQTEQAKGAIDTDRVRVIWKTPPYPDYHWTIRGNLEERFGKGFRREVAQALIGLSDHPEIMESFSRERFVPASNKDYQRILEVGRKIGIIER